MSQPNTPCVTDGPATPNGDSVQQDGSALALDAQHAIKQDNVIGSYEPYAEWLASHERGCLYLKQAISALAWHLHKTGNLQMMWQAVDEVNGAARCLVDEKTKAQNDRTERPAHSGAQQPETL